MTRGKFLSSSFDARLVLLQILCVESLFYLTFVASTVFVKILFGFRFGLYQFFDFKQFSLVEDSSKTTLCIMLWLNLALLAVFLPKIIERTRKCLDFVLTLSLLHLLFSTLYIGFPTTLSWWLVWTVGATICVLLGEYLCMQEEQREIHLESNIELGDKTSPRIAS
jgi:hypothetical protein